MEQSSNSIVEQTVFVKKRVLRALLKIRMVLATDIPDIFSGTVEVDETYLGGAWKINERLSGILERNEAEAPRSNLFSKSSAGLARSERIRRKCR
jgi:hypothetical protein